MPGFPPAVTTYLFVNLILWCIMLCTLLSASRLASTSDRVQSAIKPFLSVLLFLMYPYSRFLFSGKTPGRCYFMPQNYGKYFNYQKFFFIFVLGQKNPDTAQVVPG
jgi:hypothetical protein